MLTILRIMPKARAKTCDSNVKASAQLEQPWERKIPYSGEAEGQRQVKWVTDWCYGTTSGRLVSSRTRM